MRAAGKRGRAPALAFYQLFSFFEAFVPQASTLQAAKTVGRVAHGPDARSINAAPGSPRFQNSFSSFPFLHTYLVSVLRDQEFGVLV